METDATDQDAYAAGVAAAQELDGLATVQIVRRAAEALAGYLTSREVMFGTTDHREMGSIAHSFCDGFFATLD